MRAKVRHNSLESSKKNSYKILLLLGAILVITFLSFSPTLRNDFINLDDYHFILENPYVLSLDLAHLIGGFKAHFFNVYTPLTVLTFAVEHHFFGFNPFVYHLDNLLLHLAVTALIFRLLLRLGLPRWVVVFSTLIFGVHPLHVQSVAWATERKDVLYAFFYMLALNFYWDYLATKSGWKYLGSVLFGLFSMLAKPMALSLPVILFLLDWLKGRSLSRMLFLDKIPYVVYIIRISLITYHAYSKGGSPSRLLMEGDIFTALSAWLWTFSFYVQKFFLPINLVPKYFLPKPVGILRAPYLISLLVFLLCIGGLARWRRNRWVVFSFAYLAGSMFFLFPYGKLLKNWVGVADRFIYLPSVGFCLLVGIGCYALHQRFLKIDRRLSVLYGFILGLMICALAGQTFRLAHIWNNSLTFWTYDLTHNPKDATRALVYRGYFYLEKEQIDLAMSDANRAIAADPNLSGGYALRGLVFQTLGQEQKALDDFNNAIQINDGFVKSIKTIFAARALVYIQQGAYNLAIKDCDQVIKKDSNYARAYSNRGKAYMFKGDLDAALDDFNRAVFLNARDHLAYYDRGYLFFLKKDYDRALADLSQAIALNPQDYTAYDQRGNIYYLMKRYELALEDYNRAVSFKPDFARGYNNRGSLFLATQQYDQARDDFTKAIALSPDLARAYYNRSLAWQALAKKANALDDAMKAQSLGYAVDDGFLQQLRESLDPSLKNPSEKKSGE